MQMAAMPDGTSVADRLLVGVEDLGLGMLASGGGRLGGALAASRLRPIFAKLPRCNCCGRRSRQRRRDGNTSAAAQQGLRKLGTDSKKWRSSREMRQQELIKTLIESGLVTADGVRLLT